MKISRLNKLLQTKYFNMITINSIGYNGRTIHKLTLDMLLMENRKNRPFNAIEKASFFLFFVHRKKTCY